MNNQRQNSINFQSRRYLPQPLRTLLVLTLLVGFAFALVGTSAAQASEPSAASTVAQKMNPMNWHMPSFRMPEFLVRHDDQERIVERKNGLVSDIKGTASRSWQRTKETLNPARLNPMNLFAGPATTQPSAEKKPGFFSSLLSPMPPEPPERVATVNEWLGQERP